MGQEYRFIAREDQEGSRLDRCLAATGVMSRRKARALLQQGAVYLNGRRVKIASRIVRAGDDICCHFSSPDTPTPVPSLEVLFHDAHLVVVNKPPGVPVQATVASDCGTLVEAVHTLIGRGRERPRVVHRLDRPASGAVALALTRKAAAGLSAQMADHATRRQYLVAVEGACATEGSLAHYLAPAGHGQGHSLLRVCARPAIGAPRGGERKAITRFRRLAQGAGHSLLLATLETGRTHQVRAQLAFEGFPVAGDVRYGARNRLPGGREIALHAWVLDFVHPVTGVPVQVSAPLPPALETWLEVVGLRVPHEPAEVHHPGGGQNEAYHGKDHDEATPRVAHRDRPVAGR